MSTQLGCDTVDRCLVVGSYVVVGNMYLCVAASTQRCWHEYLGAIQPLGGCLVVGSGPAMCSYVYLQVLKGACKYTVGV